MKKLILSLMLGSSFVGTAYAGYKYDTPAPPSVVRRTNGTISVGGFFGNARATSDNVSYIGCSVFTMLRSDGTVYQSGTCSGQNTFDGASCTTTNPAFIAAIHGVKGDSYIGFEVNTSGACTSLDIQNQSQFRPKTL